MKYIIFKKSNYSHINKEDVMQKKDLFGCLRNIGLEIF